MGFSRKIINTTSFLAVMWSLLDELIFCLSQNIFAFEVELDAKSIVDALANFSLLKNVVSPILDDCRQLVFLFFQVRIKYCFREANRCTNRLVRIGTNQNSNFILYEGPPVDLVKIAKANLNGMYQALSYNSFCSVIYFLLLMLSSLLHQKKNKKLN